MKSKSIEKWICQPKGDENSEVDCMGPFHWVEPRISDMTALVGSLSAPPSSDENKIFRNSLVSFIKAIGLSFSDLERQVTASQQSLIRSKHAREDVPLPDE
jgi:hypothetical protein